jgi:urease accessory protein
MKGNVLRQMTRISWRETVLATAALPLAPAAAWAQADAYLGSGFLAGFLHSISGVDHLLLLVGIGAAASCISAQLLLWALAGAIGGGVF